MRDYLTEMLYALTSAYSHKDHDNRRRGAPVQTNIGKLFSVFAWGLNTVQEQADLIKLWDNLDYACGSVLDRYGANFGVQRYGADDTFYRLAIKVKLLSQLSGGDINTVLNATAELLDVELSDVILEEVFPAKIALYVDQALLSEERIRLIEPIMQAIKRILAAGVGMRIYLRTYRTYRYDFLVRHAGAVGTFFSHQCVGKDREIVWAMPVALGGAAVTNRTSAPVGEDRDAQMSLGVGRVGILQAVFSPPLIGQDKTVQQSVSVAHSGYVPPLLSGIPPNIKRAARGRQEGAGGAYTRTHIKPKRVD